jgi:uncharacterized protein with PIN domain
MIERLQAGHRYALRLLLSLVAHRPVESLVARLMRGAHRRSRSERRPLSDVLRELHESVRTCAIRRLQKSGAGDLWSARRMKNGRSPRTPGFICDGSLGGLCRWLRAAGYETEWRPGAAAHEVIGDVLEDERRILITSDSRVLDRPEVHSEAIVVLWVPSNLRRIEQAAWIMRDLSLTPGKPRCMACGGELRCVDKGSVSDRIPPRTARWKNEYQLCRECGRLYWEGTHWDRIRTQLDRLQSENPCLFDVRITKV